MLTDDIKAFLGFADSGMNIHVQITPINARLPLRNLVPISGGSKPKSAAPSVGAKKHEKSVRKALEKMFGPDGLNFQEDVEDHTGALSGRMFGPNLMVTSLIEYMDSDKTSSKSADFQGFEDSLRDGFEFKNNLIDSVQELVNVPGFPLERVAQIAPYVHTKGETKVNLNLADPVVIQSLHPNLDRAQAEAIYNHVRVEGQHLESRFTGLDDVPDLDSEAVKSLKSGLLTDYGSKYFEIIVKVEYGAQRSFFGKALLHKQSGGDPPEVTEILLY